MHRNFLEVGKGPRVSLTHSITNLSYHGNLLEVAKPLNAHSMPTDVCSFISSFQDSPLATSFYLKGLTLNAGQLKSDPVQSGPILVLKLDPA